MRTLATPLLLLVALLACVSCRVRSDRLVEEGAAKASRGDYRGAIADFDEALKVYARNEDAYFFRAQARDQLKEYDAAIADFTRYIELAPLRWEGYFRRGYAQAAKEQYAAALADYTMAARRVKLEGENFQSRDHRPKSEWVRYIDECRRQASGNLVDHQSAIDALNAVLTKDPQNADALYERGAARIKNNDTAGGCEDWFSAKQLGYEVGEKAVQQFGQAKVRLGASNGLPEPCQNAR